MTRNKNLVILSNEKIFKNINGFHCDNIDMKSIPEGLNNYGKVLFFARKSNIKRSFKINLDYIYLFENIFTFLFNIYKTFKKTNTTYLIISITPFTFAAYLLLFIFKKKVFVYLRSNGYEEYKAIFGFVGPFFYHVMFSIVTTKSKIISCQKRLVKRGNYELVYPSELDEKWQDDTCKPVLDKPKILYVGRIKVEKGIFSLLKIFNDINPDIKLSIVGNTEDLKVNSGNIDLLGYAYGPSELIKIYDAHNIVILPSFTEAHPKVVDESLSRLRPVIIFEEINHIVKEKYGLFVSKRDATSLSNTIKYIISEYSNIQEKIKTNQLPTKQRFISQLAKILS